MRGRVSIASLRRSERATSFPSAIGRMKKYLDYFWPALGLVAVIALHLSALSRVSGPRRRNRGLGRAPRDLAAQLPPGRRRHDPGLFRARLVRPHRPAPPWRETYFLAVHLAVLLHHLRAFAQHRRERIFRGDGALPRLFDQGPDRLAGRRAGGAVLLHLRLRQCAARRPAADLRSRSDAAPVRLPARYFHASARGARRGPRLPRRGGALHHRLADAFQAVQNRQLRDHLPPPRRHGAAAFRRAAGVDRRRRASSISRCPRTAIPVISSCSAPSFCPSRRRWCRTRPAGSACSNSCSSN